MDAWTNLERKYGTVESVCVLGTYPLVLTKTVMRSVTFSDVHFHSRTIHFEWRWQDGKLVVPIPDVVQPPLTSFVPTSTATFSNFFCGGGKISDRCSRDLQTKTQAPTY